VAPHYQTHALAEARHRQQVDVVETLTDGDALGECGLSPLRVSVPQPREGVPDAQPRVFWTLGAAFEYAATACEPSHCRCGLATKHPTRPDQESVARGAPRVVAPNGFVVSARPREHRFLVMSGQVRGESELLQIVEIERRGGVRRREPRVRVTPRAFGE
jgi:hypothetical protein